MKLKEHPEQFKIINLLRLIIVAIMLVMFFDNINQAFIRNKGGLALLHGDYYQVKSLFENMEGDEALIAWHLYGIYDQTNNPDKAREALELAGYDWQTLMEIGETYIWPTHDYTYALRWYNRAQRINENSTILFMQAQVYELMGNPSMAIDNYSEALEMDTFETEDVNASNVLVRLASIHHVEYDDRDTAWNLANQALELNQFGTHLEDKAQAYYLQGQIGANRGNDPSISIDKYQLALNTSPEHYWANLMLGWEYYRAGRPLDTVVNQIHHAISLDPNNKWGYLILAGIYVNVGDSRAAKELYEQVLLLDPNDLTAIEFTRNNP